MADCVADSAGGLTFDLTVHDGSAGRWDAALLLRVRPEGCGGGRGCVCAGARGAGGARGVRADGPGRRERAVDQQPEDVRLPLYPFGGTRLRATMPSTMTLDEGHWDAHVTLGDGLSWRLRTGRLDTRPLNERDPGSHRAWLGVRVPYAGAQGALAVRSWHRAPHAELARVRTSPAGLLLRGRLFGTRLGSAARMVAWPREPAGPAVTAAWRDPAATATPTTGATVDGHGTTTPHPAPEEAVTTLVRRTGDGAEFTATLSLDRLSAPPAEWDVWLLPNGSGQAVRPAWLLDDVPDKRPHVSYPAQHTRSALFSRSCREVTSSSL
ncbi:hypothetical protein [Streptomyces oceani]|uniref:hypothetical protein n=1 Tax=Streptomyces oceani TaxID=1075402 RepID=UPI000871CC3E|nr:hypothetical protein [Streptomyces oceani]